MMRRPFWPATVLAAAMAMAACGGTGAGTPAAQRSAAPGIDGGCPESDQGEEGGLPPSYRPLGNALEGDLRGDPGMSRATIDGERGLEIVVDFGGPMHPHRSGQIFTFDEGSFVAMRTERPQFEEGRPILFPLHGEFAGGVDCTGKSGAIVVTTGDLAEGGADDPFRSCPRGG